jgi:predicted transcriptional regulator
MTIEEPTNDSEDEKKILHVKFESREQSFESVQDKMEQIDSGRRESFDPTHVLSFRNFEDFASTFSAKKMELLQTISAHEPESIRETARLVDRDVSYVHHHLTELKEVGIIEFDENGRSKRPTVEYDEIEMNIPLPLPHLTGDRDETAEPSPA